jgi:DNA polymerase-3 subunit chi
MARIDFAFGAQDRLAQACQTVLRQYLAGQRVLVYCPDLTRLQTFDRQLWAVQDTAFVPHVFSDNPAASQTAVLLVQNELLTALKLVTHEAWLVNLSDQCPETLGEISRVLEIVSEDEADKEAARKRWADYKAAGHELKAHRLGA